MANKTSTERTDKTPYECRTTPGIFLGKTGYIIDLFFYHSKGYRNDSYRKDNVSGYGPHLFKAVNRYLKRYNVEEVTNALIASKGAKLNEYPLMEWYLKDARKKLERQNAVKDESEVVYEEPEFEDIRAETAKRNISNPKRKSRLDDF